MGKFDSLSAQKQRAILLLTRQIIDPDAPEMKLQEIADEIGVDQSTLFRWRTQDSEFMEARKELVDKYADEIVGDAFTALRYQVKKKKNVKAAEVLLKSRGMLVDRKEVSGDMTLQHSDVSSQDNDALMAELEQLKAKLSDAD